MIFESRLSRTALAFALTIVFAFTSYVTWVRWLKIVGSRHAFVPLLVGGLIAVVLAWIGVFRRRIWSYMALAVLFTGGFAFWMLGMLLQPRVHGDLLKASIVQTVLWLMMALYNWERVIKERGRDQSRQTNN